MSIYYLVSSLPSFSFGDKPFYTSESFIRLCTDWVNDSDMKELESISLTARERYSGQSPFALKWYKLIGAIANSTVKLRAAKLNRDSSELLKEQKVIYSDIDKAVQDAFAAENPMEKEKKLDRLKWFVLDSLEVGHFFDFDKLCIYKLRILLSEKWLARKEAEGIKNLDKALAILYTPSEEK
ncbi:MAG TPA: hypothetical protein DD381_06215 [Lentisphaeria bacterium]|nr:MAG: hypothetical protein A2X47_05200 [Lentisphaerae bacterium GWF2_38_69]HBM15921.1 hypothetical protein [Lentisphaeria bacterium]